MMESKSLRLEFVIDDPAMPPDTFMVADFTGNETISQPFRFEVNLVSYEPALSLTDVANKPATLEIYRGDEQLVFHGQVAHFDQGVHVGDRYGYTAVLVPKLWFLSMYFQSRIFRDLTAPEIIEKVLKDAGFSSNDYAMLLQDSGVFPTREYCVH
jgi:type VI secretion system secreted protein VgrG